jgi:Flp pilus assembly protein TadG
MQIHNRDARRGASAAELAVVLPLLIFILVIAADFARLYYYSITITSAARQGVLNYYDNQNNPFAATLSPYPNPTYQQAALADATNLNPQPTVNTNSGTDATGNPFVEVTVSGTFSTVTGYPGIPRTVNLSRTVRMRVPPAVPK